MPRPDPPHPPPLPQSAAPAPAPAADTPASTLTPPADASPQTAALWSIAAAAPALVADRGWGAPGSDATTWKGVEVDDDGHVVGLDVSEGGMTAFPAGALRALPRLTALQASTNAIRTLPDEAGTLTSLTSLNVANNAVADVPPCVAALTGLRVLGLGLNPITALPASLASLTAVDWLDASECRLTDAGPVGGMTALTRLDLHSNRLAALPAGVGALSKLERLSLHSNELESVGEEVRGGKRGRRGGGKGFLFPPAPSRHNTLPFLPPLPRSAPPHPWSGSRSTATSSRPSRRPSAI